MKSPVGFALGLAFAVGLPFGCSGSDNAPIVSSSPTTAFAEDQRTSPSDTLTPAEASQVDQANAEPAPPPKPDL